MKILTVLICLCVLMGCGEKVEPKQQEEAPSTPKVEANAPVTPKPQPKEELENPQPPKTTPEKLIADPIIEKAIREALSTPFRKFTGELTKADLEKVTKLYLYRKQLSEVPKGLEKLTQLTNLSLVGNPDLTKAQIAKLQKVLPKCLILSDYD